MAKVKSKMKAIGLMDLVLLRDTIKKLGGISRFKATLVVYSKITAK
jgi:hypothetical protein